jgi:polyphenol oxidase
LVAAVPATKQGGQKTESREIEFRTGCGTVSAPAMGGLSRAYCPEDAPGELNLGFTADDDRNLVSANRSLLAEARYWQRGHPARDHPPDSLQRAGALHCGKGAARETLCKGDGLMTDQPGVLLGVQTADCIPVLVADRKRRAVAAFHAGWRGTVKRIAETAWAYAA